MLTELDFREGRMTASGYAALWGGDPCYDSPPRLHGDGYLFYNFAVEGNNPEFRVQFLPAIDRTIKERNQRGGRGTKADVEDLELLKAHVERM
jgi:hypothetical protein